MMMKKSIAVIIFTFIVVACLCSDNIEISLSEALSFRDALLHAGDDRCYDTDILHHTRGMTNALQDAIEIPVVQTDMPIAAAYAQVSDRLKIVPVVLAVGRPIYSSGDGESIDAALAEIGRNLQMGVVSEAPFILKGTDGMIVVRVKMKIDDAFELDSLSEERISCLAIVMEAFKGSIPEFVGLRVVDRLTEAGVGKQIQVCRFANKAQ